MAGQYRSFTFLKSSIHTSHPLLGKASEGGGCNGQHETASARRKTKSPAIKAFRQCRRGIAEQQIAKILVDQSGIYQETHF
jgi:hypothetical protein